MTNVGRACVLAALPVAVILGAASAWVSPAWAQTGFERRDFPAGGGALEAVIGDFDNDGEKDVATTQGGGAAVLISDGRGGFREPVSYGVGGGSPRSIRAADLNKDGRLDLFTADGNQTTTVSVLYGNGDGTFGSPQTLQVGSFPTSAISADFDADGNPDIAAASQNDNRLTVLLGNGQGSFAQSHQAAFGNLPQQLAAADFNKDGKTDIASANAGSWDGSLALGNGDGTFQAPTSFSTGRFPRSIATGDFNKDGTPDLATANAVDDSVSVLLGNGNGGFARTDFTVGDEPHGVAVGDLDNDGDADIAASNRAGNSVTVLAGNGAGSFTDDGATQVGGSPWFLTAGDVNGDAVDDLAVANSGEGTVSVLTNTAIKADLAITKDLPAESFAGRDLRYTITVANNGPDTARGVGLEDNLQAGLEFVSASPGCAGSGGVVTCALGDLPNGASRSVELVVRPSQVGEYSGAATVRSRTADTVPGNNSDAATTTARLAADLQLSNTPSAARITSGDELSWTLVVRNNGPAAASGLRLVDELPPGAEVTGINAAGCSTTGDPATGQTVTCDHGGTTIAAGATYTMAVITARVSGAGEISNTATISASVGDPDTANNTATARTTVVPPNTAPTARPDSYAARENTPLAVRAPGLLSNDSDPDGDTLSADLVSRPKNGSLMLSRDGSFTYTPNGGFTGADSFAYAATDGTARSGTATVNIAVSPPPAIQNIQTRLTLSARPGAIQKGQRAVLSGRLTGAGRGLAGERVVLERRPAGARGFSPVKKVSTARDGTFRATVEPRRDTAYRTRFLGGDDAASRLSPSTSPVRRVDVRPAGRDVGGEVPR